MIPTGLRALDEFLSGGIPEGAVTDIYGPHGTGKTQLLFQLSSHAIQKNGRVLYVDTSGSFRPERIVEIQKNTSASDMLDDITVLRVTNTHEQIRSLQTMGDLDFELILVDNVTDLFSYEYQSNEQTFEKNSIFMRYMRGLSLHAIGRKIPIVVTNMVRNIYDREVENMHTAIDLFTHVKLGLSRSEKSFSGRAAWLQHSLDFSYVMGPGGLSDADESI